ncbi:MAG: 2,3-bisphosphoglycerate-independent phosphoglycerate mutase [Bacteroidota bacterium]
MDVSSDKALLVILDGLGLGDDYEGNAVARAHTPCLDQLMEKQPNSRLSASGEDVGLPEGQFGNSEVGHLNIGAGRIVWQELSRINKSIRDRSFYENEALKSAFKRGEERGKVHLLGLFSDGGVHSHLNHLDALLEMASGYDLDQVAVHAFTDGRDTSPHGGINYYKTFLESAQRHGTGSLASIIGRYYAMDRDHRWERTELAYDLLVHGKGTQSDDPESAFRSSYEEGITDEFIKPHLFDNEHELRIEPGDSLIFFNIRADRVRQIIKALLAFDEVPFGEDDLKLEITTFTSYDETFASRVHVAYPPAQLINTLGQWVASKSLRQLRISETEKYPHVTYFFNGGNETPNPNEDRILVPSPKVATYDQQPEMSATEVTDKLTEALSRDVYNLVIVNYANPDMVGHTGDLDAAIKAVETVDHELSKVLETAREHGYKTLIIADHGNADQMIQPDGSPHTAHTTAPVPAILDGVERVTMRNGVLADVAPTLLKMMGLSQPNEMTGKPLYSS